MKIKGLFFDLDGTLYLSTPILHSCYAEGIKNFNREQNQDVRIPTEKEVLAQVGNPVEEIYTNLFPNVDDDLFQPLSENIVSTLLQKIRTKQGKLVEGVQQVLEKLKTDYRLGLVTNAQRAYLETVAETHGLDEYFARMICIEEIDSNDKADLIKIILADYGLKPKEVMMVGDRSSDLNAARTAGTGFVGCLYGHGDLAGKYPVLDEFRDLPALLAEISD